MLPRKPLSAQTQSPSMAAMYPLNMGLKKVSIHMTENIGEEAQEADTSLEETLAIISTLLVLDMITIDTLHPEDTMTMSLAISKSEEATWEADEGLILDIVITIATALVLRATTTILLREIPRTCQCSRLSSSCPMNPSQLQVSFRRHQVRNSRELYQAHLPAIQWEVLRLTRKGRTSMKKDWSRSRE